MPTTEIIGKRARVELNNFTAQDYPGWTEDGYIGWYDRKPSNGYVLETFVEFDITSSIPSDAVIDNVYFVVSVDNTGVEPTVESTMNFFVQDRTANNVWNSNNRQPWYYDFSNAEWTNLIATAQVQAQNFDYFIGSNQASADIVKDWATGARDQKDGAILSANFNSTISLFHITQIKAVVAWGYPSNWYYYYQMNENS